MKVRCFDLSNLNKKWKFSRLTRIKFWKIILLLNFDLFGQTMFNERLFEPKIDFRFDQRTPLNVSNEIGEFSRALTELDDHFPQIDRRLKVFTNFLRSFRLFLFSIVRLENRENIFRQRNSEFARTTRKNWTNNNSDFSSKKKPNFSNSTKLFSSTIFEAKFSRKFSSRRTTNSRMIHLKERIK